MDDGNVVIATDLYCDYIDKRAKIKLGDLFSIDNPFQYFEKLDVVLYLA